MNIEIKKHLKLGLIILIIVLVGVFTLQNVEVVTVDFLWLEISMSRAILVVVLLLIGFVVGKFSRLKKKNKHLQD